MKLILLGICLLCAGVGVEGRTMWNPPVTPSPGWLEHPNHHMMKDGTGANHDDDWKGWETCCYEDEGRIQRIKCRSCCGDEGDQYCCDDEYDDSHEDDDHWKRGHHKVIVIIVGCLAGVVFMVVSISCCVFYMKYKKQQSAQLHPGKCGGVVIPTSQPAGKTSPPDADLYTGQKKEQLGITGVLTASPPYNTKY